ncbi:MAG TPA: NAD-dependent epimerase/dehydratase family protein [Caulobacteraceae bacterium]|nr:NAD-dependent epimerase/dehydratase family protein [Caulobacteraceae bacterium]
MARAGFTQGRLAAVTGATGFLGRRLVLALRAAGWRIRVLVRPSSPGMGDDADVEVVFGDLGDPAALATLAEGTDVVVHAAGLIKARDRAAFFDVNVEGVRRIARVVGEGRMILISSLAAREPALSDYAASKRTGEEAARSVLGERLTVLRPPAIYGPGDRETLALFRLAGAAPCLPTPGSTSARLALAYVDDVAASVLGRLDQSWSPGVFAIGGARPEGYGWREIFETAAAAMGRRPILAPVPDALIKVAAAASEFAAGLRGQPAIFTRGKARELLHPDWTVSAAESPPGPPLPSVDLRTGFERTVAWYRQAGWLR